MQNNLYCVRLNIRPVIN